MSRYDVKMRLESQFSRMNCQMFSTGLSSGDFAGRGSRVMFLGMVSLAERCEPPRSSSTTEWAPGATAWEISQIAGWLKQEFPTAQNMHISHEAIYRSLF